MWRKIMMECQKFNDITYGNKLFCKACGMDIGFDPIKRKDELYCCEDCAKTI
jgi:hypothetical protein